MHRPSFTRGLIGMLFAMAATVTPSRFSDHHLRNAGFGKHNPNPLRPRRYKGSKSLKRAYCKAASKRAMPWQPNVKGYRYQGEAGNGKQHLIPR